MIRAAVLALIGLCLTACPAAAAGPGIDATFDAQGVTVLEDGSPVLFYRTKSANPDTAPARLNYIHPLYAPDGTVLTEDAPTDHPSQRGLYWAWDRVLLNGKIEANGSEMQGLTYFVRSTRFEGRDDGSAFLIVTVDWIDHAKDELTFLASETTRIHIFPTKDKTRRLDFETTLTPKVDGLALGASVDPSQHGGFTLRLVDPTALVFSSDGATVQPTPGPVKTGVSVGFAWASGGPAWGVGVTCKANDLPLNHWVLRTTLSAQNCVFPSGAPWVLTKDNPLRLQTSLVISPKTP